jgi:ribose/xylose/arabinose/galactoside ABC-type transport system permease subunit
VELSAIAGAVVGGTLLSGGVGSIAGGFLGILLIDTLRTGVVLLGFPSDNFAAVVGVTIVGVAILNEWIRGRLSLGL